MVTACTTHYTGPLVVTLIKRVGFLFLLGSGFSFAHLRRHVLLTVKVTLPALLFLIGYCETSIRGSPTWNRKYQITGLVFRIRDWGGSDSIGSSEIGRSFVGGGWIGTQMGLQTVQCVVSIRFWGLRLGKVLCSVIAKIYNYEFFKIGILFDKNILKILDFFHLRLSNYTNTTTFRRLY